MKVVRVVANPLLAKESGIGLSTQREAHQNSLRRLRTLNPDAVFELTLIVGLPGDNYDSFLGSLDFALAMQPRELRLEDPPDRLFYNETFPWEEYVQAKHVAYHAALFQKDRWLRDRLLELVRELRGTHVDLHAGLAEVAVDRGLPTLQGKDVRDIGTDELEAHTELFLSDAENVRLLHELFLEYRKHIRGSRRANHVAMPRRKRFERWVRGGL